MKRLLYPLIASALITVVPFLLTFEKGQDIVRGLFGYEYLALLLLIAFIKNHITTIPAFAGMTKKALLQFISSISILALLIISLFTVAWIDLQNLLSIKNWPTGWYGILPFITCGIAVAMVWQTKPFKFNAIYFILFVALILHLEAYNQYAAQPLAQFPTIDYLERIAPKPIQRKNISEEFYKKYNVTDSVTITRDFVDTTRNNVIILVESWGVPLDMERFEKQLDIFKGITTAKGIHNRMYSRTRTAEREDLIKTISRNSTSKRDTLFLPIFFSDCGYKTRFLFGGDSLEQWRSKYIKNIGFNKAIYGKTLSAGKRLNDAKMIAIIDSILTDTTQKHFIAWTTTDTKFPMSEYPDIYYTNADIIDSAYSFKLHSDFIMIADLARRHPETRFTIQGDHNPILSPIEFQKKFYKRWVPYVILN